MDAFLAKKNVLGITACEVGTANDVNSIFGRGIKGCDAQCVITPNYGEKCVVKSGFTGERLATQGLWIDRTTNFDWNTQGMINYQGDEDNHYYTGNASNKTEKRRCNPANGYNVGNYGYRPTATGWHLFKCEKWDCFFLGGVIIVRDIKPLSPIPLKVFMKMTVTKNRDMVIDIPDNS
ncbi:hypothetical protein [Tenacibaculum sp. C7A-26P2]|uniref:hypothetical protein n=1 Tax=Tenacibaculum sp. C7A-26P2 TaxID=3447504 RepID=UPI003F859E99